jgi:hypothetical protein
MTEDDSALPLTNAQQLEQDREKYRTDPIYRAQIDELVRQLALERARRTTLRNLGERETKH